MTDIFVIGHPRCGTTSLHYWLSQVSCVQVPSNKEARFFDINYLKGQEWYESHFKSDAYCSKDKIWIDCDPNYSFVNFAAERMHEMYPKAKIVQIVREPFKRIYSWWRLFHTMRAGREPRPFHQFWAEETSRYDPGRFAREGNYIPYLDPKGGSYQPFILESGAYFHTWERFSLLFDQEIFVIAFEDLMQNKMHYLKKIVGLADGEVTEDIDFSPANINDSWRKRNFFLDEVDDELKNIVNRFYTTELYYFDRATHKNFSERYISANVYRPGDNGASAPRSIIT